MENNDSTPPAQTALTTRQNGTKNTQKRIDSRQNTDRVPAAITWKQREVVSVEKQERKKVWRKPMAPFPRLSRHLELLPSSESFPFDWRYFHLPRTQVMFKSLPFYYA